MGINNKLWALREIRFFKGLSDEEISQLAAICNEESYNVGDICQSEGQSSNHVHIIVKGRMGAILRFPGGSFSNNEIIIETLGPGDLFGWSALIKGTPWSTLKVLEAANVLYVNADDMLSLCEKNYHIGYEVMKNLSALISSRLRKNRMSILNALVAMKGEGS